METQMTTFRIIFLKTIKTPWRDVLAQSSVLMAHTLQAQKQHALIFSSLQVCWNFYKRFGLILLMLWGLSSAWLLTGMCIWLVVFCKYFIFAYSYSLFLSFTNRPVWFFILATLIERCFCFTMLIQDFAIAMKSSQFLFTGRKIILFELGLHFFSFLQNCTLLPIQILILLCKGRFLLWF